MSIFHIICDEGATTKLNIPLVSPLIRSVFKRAASKVEKELKEAGYTVSINATKPRKGSFVVTIEGQSKPVIELLDLQRPFKKLREFDIDAAVGSIVNK